MKSSVPDVVDSSESPRHPDSLWQLATDDSTPEYHVDSQSPRLPLVGSTGAYLLDLMPTLRLSHSRIDHPPASIAPRGAEVVLEFGDLRIRRGDDGTWHADGVASTNFASYVIHVSNVPGDPQLRYEVATSYQGDVLVHWEVLDFATGPLGDASVMNRGYELRPPDNEQVRVGPMTPKLATFGNGRDAVTIDGGTSNQAMQVTRLRDGRNRVTLELDHEDNHPYTVYTHCEDKTGTRVGRAPLRGSERHAGETRHSYFSWIVGDAKLINIARYPAGFRGAMVFSDHADQSNAAKLEAFAFGRSGAIARGELGPDYPGFVNRGLRYTKSIFLAPAYGYAPQFEDSAYRTVLNQMEQNGVEIAVHTPSGRRDDVDDTSQTLGEFRETFEQRHRTWIDHQPDTNCEAIANRGWDSTSPWFMLGVLGEHGFDYLWSAQDLARADHSLNLLAPDRSGERRPVLYRHNRLDTSGGHSFTLFTSSYFFVDRTKFGRTFDTARLEQLEFEHGLFVGHTYLDSFRESGHYINRSLLQRDGAGDLIIRPEIDGVFQRLAERQIAGQLWVTGIEALGDHLSAAFAARLEYLPGGTVRIESDVAIDNLTLRMPPGIGVDSVTVEGATVAGAALRPEGQYVWFDIGPLKPVTLRVEPAGDQFTFMDPAFISLDQ